MRYCKTETPKLIVSPIIMAGLVFGLFACSSPERAAKIIGKKATQKVTQLCLPSQLDSEACLSELEQFLRPPSFSESISDKTEIISTW
ncbi:MAG TPA: hypothetical protein VJA82_03695 [Sediminibacterium sp.]|uniref:hypothetical protein n=1 Tax=Sediminibacterium sp. TaxID=1917865 RepID=UPI0026C4464E|nr:hypothetical protein [Sediminibacterium sp.]HLD52382.1 hypothetical protein [Sediminibacterium sp.]